jgi:hypothetical protein
MDFREGEHVCISLVFGFGYDCSFDPFSRIVNENISQIGDADIRWPEQSGENGFKAGTSYEVPVEITAIDDFDDDSVRYMLKRMRKQITDAGISLAALDIRKEEN